MTVQWYIGISLALMLAGLAVCWLSPSAGTPLLTRVFWWIGILCALCGALMILAKIIVWVATQLQSALGV
jgi:hypothetical protein